MTRRYYVPDLPDRGGPVALSDEEARHASRVMRVQCGDAVTLFDGRGNECSALVQSIDKRQCLVDAKSPAVVDRELRRSLELAVALPKPERAKELVERLAELGVKRLVPVTCHRTQRPPSESLLGKLRRVVIESCKQSGRNVLMEIVPPVDFKALMQSAVPDQAWIAHPDGDDIARLGDALSAAESLRVVIGPEGGFTDDEVGEAVASGYLRVGLGERIYRIETAAVALAAIAGVTR